MHTVVAAAAAVVVATIVEVVVQPRRVPQHKDSIAFGQRPWLLPLRVDQRDSCQVQVEQRRTDSK